MLNVAGAVKEQKAPEVARPDRSKHREWLMIGGIGSAVVAAACLVFILMTPKIADSEIVIEPTPAPQPELVCHIDGVQITDRSVAYAEVNKIHTQFDCRHGAFGYAVRMKIAEVKPGGK
jgi:hypothetical protein